MKAIILAAGLGTRLRPLTNTVPKCLVEVCGKPLLEWWLILLQKHGITEYLINTHHLPELVEKFVHERSTRYGLTPTVFYEPVLLGSAGTLLANESYIAGEKDFFVLYADNLTNANLSQLLAFHRSKPADMSITLYRMPHPETRGIADVDQEGKILSFIEKPQRPKSDLANGGIYVMTSNLIRHISNSNPEAFDIGKDILQANIASIYGLEMHGYLRDIGTLESLAAAQTEWPSYMSVSQ